MLKQRSPCRLCLQLSRHGKHLYDTQGQRTEIHELITTHISSELLDREWGRHLKAVCAKCCRHIFDFHNFKKEVMVHQQVLMEQFVRLRNMGYGNIPRASVISSMEEENTCQNLENRITKHSNLSHMAEISRDVRVNNVSLGSNPTIKSNTTQHPSIISAAQIDSQVKIDTTAPSLISNEFEHPLVSRIIVNPSESISPCAVSEAFVPESLSDTGLGQGEKPASEIPPDPLSTNPTTIADIQDELSEDSDQANEELDEFDDPVGTFVGGEFDKSAAETEESEDRSSESEWSASNSYSSEDELPLKRYTSRTRRQSKLNDQNDEQRNHRKSPSESYKNPKRKKLYKTALEFDASESESDISDDQGNKKSTSIDNKISKGSDQIPEQNKHKDADQTPVNIEGKNKSDNANKAHHKTACEFDNSETESSAFSERPNEEKDIVKERTTNANKNDRNNKRQHKTAFEFDASETESSASSRRRDDESRNNNDTISQSEIPETSNKYQHKTAYEYDTSENESTVDEEGLETIGGDEAEITNLGNEAGSIKPVDEAQKTNPGAEFQIRPSTSYNDEVFQSSENKEIRRELSNDSNNKRKYNYISHARSVDHSEDEIKVEHHDNGSQKISRRIKRSYLKHVKKPQTAQEFDESIAKWRPNLECVICQETYSTFSLLKQHFSDHHPTEKCYISCCQIKFYQRYEIEKHIRYHNEPKAYKCEVCYSCYTTGDALRNHLKDKHSGKDAASSFKCHKCSRSFVTRTVLEKHIQYSCDKLANMEKQRHFQCNDCGKKYNSKISLGVHRRNTHMGKDAKKLNCEICDKVFSCPSDFRQHMNHHKGVRGVVCQWCPQAFFGRSEFYKHALRQHPREYKEYQKEKEERRKVKKTYNCPNCDNVYQTPLAMKEHQAVHNIKIAYRCKLCPNEYKYSSNLAAHVKRVHKKEGQTEKISTQKKDEQGKKGTKQRNNKNLKVDSQQKKDLGDDVKQNEEMSQNEVIQKTNNFEEARANQMMIESDPQKGIQEGTKPYPKLDRPRRSNIKY